MFDMLTDGDDENDHSQKKMKFSKFQKFGKFRMQQFADEGEDIGEDMGEDGMLSNNYLVKKNIGKLHKYRERIQVLNEDLNVLIFDGEEDIEIEHPKSNNIASLQVQQN